MGAGRCGDGTRSRTHTSERTDRSAWSGRGTGLLQGHGRAKERRSQDGSLPSWGSRQRLTVRYISLIVVDAKHCSTADRQNRRADSTVRTYIKVVFATPWIRPSLPIVRWPAATGSDSRLDANGKALAATGQPARGLASRRVALRLSAPQATPVVDTIAGAAQVRE